MARSRRAPTRERASPALLTAAHDAACARDAAFAREAVWARHVARARDPAGLTPLALLAEPWRLHLRAAARSPWWRQRVAAAAHAAMRGDGGSDASSSDASGDALTRIALAIELADDDSDASDDDDAH